MTKITLAHSDLTNTIYAIVGKEKIDITEQAVAEVRAIKALEQEPCEDVVSREEAIRVLKENCSHWDTNVMLIDIATDLLKKLPSVTPTRKKGKWIKKNNDYFDWYECSECGYGSDGEMKYNRLCDVRTKFCPDCGSQNLKGE